TTCLAQLGKTIETMHHRRNPHAAGHIPVIYITVPPAATPRMIAVEFARFLGLPLTRRSNSPPAPPPAPPRMIGGGFARSLGLPLTRRSNVTDVLESVCGVCLDAR